MGTPSQEGVSIVTSWARKLFSIGERRRKEKSPFFFSSPCKTTTLQDAWRGVLLIFPMEQESALGYNRRRAVFYATVTCHHTVVRRPFKPFVPFSWIGYTCVLYESI